MPSRPTGKVAALEHNMPGQYHPGSITGRVRGPASDPAVIYIDGSVSRHRLGRNLGWITGWGYLATDGRYGCGKYPQFVTKGGTDKTVTTVTDLRAIWHAICTELTTTSVTVVTDGEDAATTIDAWRAGSTRMPAGYTGSTRKVPTLEKLRLAIAANPGRITIQHVQGHAGDVLNEGADTLAMIGMRWARDNLPADNIRTRAENIAGGFLADYRFRR